MAPVDAERTDGVLVEAARAGDSAAFEQLYRRYFDPLFDFAARTTKSSDVAADVVQDAFIKAHDRLDQLRNPDAFRPWMYAIVRREALRFFRTQKREVTMSTLDADAASFNPLRDEQSEDLLADPVAAAELADSASLVWEAAESLDADTYTVLDLHVRQGLSSSEIADVLGISKGSAYTRVNRTKERAASAIATYLLVRKGSQDCPVLSEIVDGYETTPVSKTLKRAVDAHVRDCDECERRRRAMVAPMQVFAALAAVPPPPGLASHLWSSVSEAPSSRPTRRTFGRVVAAVLLIGLVGLGAGIGARALLGGGTDQSSPGSGTAAQAIDPFSVDAPEGAAEEGSASETTTAVDPGDGSPRSTAATDPPAAPPAGSDSGPDTSPPAPTVPASPPPPTVPPGTSPPDASAPVISNASTNPGVIFELDEDFLSCPPDTSHVSTIVANVTDEGSGVASVVAEWTVGGVFGSSSMQQVGGGYEALFGPFAYLTVPDGTSPSIPITIRATDGEGNESKETLFAVITSLGSCFG